MREHGLEPVSFGEALSIAAERMRGARVGILTGGRLTDEDSYALSKLARTVLHTDDLDHRRAFAQHRRGRAVRGHAWAVARDLQGR